jgi:hypothetical protein
VPIFLTVQEALTLGADKLAVDGVILIGEHGDYLVKDKAQTLYPRFEMFLKSRMSSAPRAPMRCVGRLGLGRPADQLLFELAGDGGFPAGLGCTFHQAR